MRPRILVSVHVRRLVRQSCFLLPAPLPCVCVCVCIPQSLGISVSLCRLLPLPCIQHPLPCIRICTCICSCSCICICICVSVCVSICACVCICTRIGPASPYLACPVARPGLLYPIYYILAPCLILPRSPPYPGSVPVPSVGVCDRALSIWIWISSARMRWRH